MTGSAGSTTREEPASGRRTVTADGRIVEGDNLAVMASLDAACCDLIYVDPPFNSNRTQGTLGGAGPSFHDRTPDGLDGYLADLAPRLRAMHGLLSDGGSLYVHLDWRAVHHVKLALDDIFGPRNFLNEIIWSYRTGGRTGKWFARKHDTILLYARCAGRHTFNVARGGCYRTKDLKTAPDGTPYKTTRSGPVHFHPDGPVHSDVWDIPFLSTVSRERTGYPTQKPEALLERIIRASSNEGDLVADFYCGSGTTPAVAARLGRRYFGCDLNPDAVAITKARLEGMRGGRARRTE